MIRKSKKGKIFKSEISGNTYRVYEWKDLGDGKIIALDKELVLEEELKG